MFFIVFLQSVTGISLSFVLTVLAHETGHLIGGLCSGYIFTSFEVFGVMIVRNFGRFKLKRSFKPCIGQCLMHPKGLDANPCFMILGGCITNLAVFAVSSMIIIAEGIHIYEGKISFATIIAVCMSVMNIAAAIMNLAPVSNTNDGSTYREVSIGSDRVQIYNRLMRIYCFLAAGEEIEKLDDGIFEAGDISDSSLSAELAGLRYLYVFFKYRFDAANGFKISIERDRLKSFSPNVLDMEEIDGIRFTGKVF